MITVGLPVFNQKNVLHIALEGLSRQEVDIEWELIVSSENDIWDLVDSYKERLNKAGCINIKYQKLEFWIPLPEKWKRIGLEMDERSLGMMLQAADCYPHPKRIKNSHHYMKNRYNWYQECKGYFYDVKNNFIALYDHCRFFPKNKYSALNMCMGAEYSRNIPDSNRTSGIDGFLFRSIPVEKRKVMESVMSYPGVDLHGLNNISIKRGKLINNLQKPFVKSNARIEKIGLPNDVVEMIKSL